MIISQSISIKISNNGKYWRSLGYGRCKQRDVINVLVEHLPPNSNKMVMATCDDCELQWEATYQSLNRNGKFHRCFSCARIEIAKHVDNSALIARSKLQSGENHPRWNPDKSAMDEYRSEVYKYTRLQPIELLNDFDKPRGLCGVKDAYQLDHIISIKEGFVAGIDAETIGDFANLRFIPWEQNLKKMSDYERSLKEGI